MGNFRKWKQFQRIVASIVGAACATPASAETSGAACSAAYHAALSEIRNVKGDALAGAVTALRASDPVLPGNWIYSRALFAKTTRQAGLIDQDRTCTDRLKVAGRWRCLRFADAATPTEPELPSELDITPQPSNDELRVLKAVADLVSGRGSVPDVGNNGRYTWLSQRATSDLRLYISQPPHPALCSGATEIVEFYDTALKPLQKRIDDVGELVKKARLQSAIRVLAIAAENIAPPAEQSHTDPALATKIQADVTQQSEASKVSEMAKQPLVTMTADAVRSVLTVADVDVMLKETSALAALQRAKPALILAQVEAQKGDDQARRDRVLAVGRAVRMIEAAAYTEVYAERYAKFAVTVLTLPRELQSVHARTCKC